MENENQGPGKYKAVCEYSDDSCSHPVLTTEAMNNTEAICKLIAQAKEASTDEYSLHIESIFDESGKMIWYYGNRLDARLDNKLILVSGPSGVGKGPIIEQVKKLCPEVYQVKARKTKTKRHTGTESDLSFKYMSDDVYYFYCRGSTQAIDLKELNWAIKTHDFVLLEVYYSAFSFLTQRYKYAANIESVFISPLDLADLQDLSKRGDKLKDYLVDLMFGSLKERAKKEKGYANDNKMPPSLITELYCRAEDSYRELGFAHNYRHIIPNHCYESDFRHSLPSQIGEAKRVIDALCDIIRKGHSDYAYKGSEFEFLRNGMKTNDDIKRMPGPPDKSFSRCNQLRERGGV